MPMIYASRVRETTTTTGTGTLTLAGAVSGFQSFSAVGNGNTCSYTLLDANGTGWETGIGTYNASGTTLARTTVLESSNSGSAISLSAGTHQVFLDFDSGLAKSLSLAPQSIIPGGRLTLQSGVPISTTDQTEKTTIYYTPFYSSIIPLWDGARWRAVEFAEVSLALGALTSGKPYDVFGYLSSGVLALELLAWTNDTTRATAVTLQGGKYCKSGDKTRLLLGSFYTTSATTTESSAQKRLVGNVYNQVMLGMTYNSPDTGHTSVSATLQPYNGETGARLHFMAPIGGAAFASCAAYLSMPTPSSAAMAEISIGIDSTTTTDLYITQLNNGNAYDVRAAGTGVTYLAPGYHYMQLLERVAGGNGTTQAGSFRYGKLRGAFYG